MKFPLSPSGSNQLPAGTVVAFHSTWLCFSLTWESSRGRHIIHSKIPAAYASEHQLWPLLEKSVRAFALAATLEAQDDATDRGF